jgi:hypothetical protein
MEPFLILNAGASSCILCSTGTYSGSGEPHTNLSDQARATLQTSHAGAYPDSAICESLLFT